MLAIPNSNEAADLLGTGKSGLPGGRQILVLLELDADRPAGPESEPVGSISQGDTLF